MLGSSKSKTKLLLMLAEAGWELVGRFFHSRGQQLVSFSIEFRFSAQDQQAAPARPCVPTAPTSAGSRTKGIQQDA